MADYRYSIMKVIRSLREYGLKWMVLHLFESKLGIRLPLSAETRWQLSLRTEVKFWDGFIRNKGYAAFAEEYTFMVQADAELRPEMKALLPYKDGLKIIDVGAGPMTMMGKRYDGRIIDITAVDPLADEYDKILERYGIVPAIRTQKCAAEELSERYGEGAFDMAYARNSIDHTYNPEMAVLEMLQVVRRGSYVLLEHIQNEAIKENWEGLHQWNFSMEGGDFIISWKGGRVNFTEKYREVCDTECVHDKERDWIWVRLRKR